MVYNGRRHPHAKVQSVSRKKTERRYRGLNSGPSHAKRRLSRLSYRAVVWCRENLHTIGFVKSWIKIRFGTVCPASLLADHKERCAKVLTRQLYWCIKGVTVRHNQRTHELKPGLKWHEWHCDLSPFKCEHWATQNQYVCYRRIASRSGYNG